MWYSRYKKKWKTAQNATMRKQSRPKQLYSVSTIRLLPPLHHHPPYRIYKSSSRDKGEFNWQQWGSTLCGEQLQQHSQGRSRAAVPANYCQKAQPLKRNKSCSFCQEFSHYDWYLVFQSRNVIMLLKWGRRLLTEWRSISLFLHDCASDYFSTQKLYIS